MCSSIWARPVGAPKRTTCGKLFSQQQTLRKSGLLLPASIPRPILIIMTSGLGDASAQQWCSRLRHRNNRLLKRENVFAPCRKLQRSSLRAIACRQVWPTQQPMTSISTRRTSLQTAEDSENKIQQMSVAWYLMMGQTLVNVSRTTARGIQGSHCHFYRRGEAHGKLPGN